MLNFLSGVHSGVVTHVPFPNTIVKDSSGDGTALRESSTMPDFFQFTSVCRFASSTNAFFLVLTKNHETPVLTKNHETPVLTKNHETPLQTPVATAPYGSGSYEEPRYSASNSSRYRSLRKRFLRRTTILRFKLQSLPLLTEAVLTTESEPPWERGRLRPHLRRRPACHTDTHERTQTNTNKHRQTRTSTDLNKSTMSIPHRPSSQCPPPSTVSTVSTPSTLSSPPKSYSYKIIYRVLTKQHMHTIIRPDITRQNKVL